MSLQPQSTMFQIVRAFRIASALKATNFLLAENANLYCDKKSNSWPLCATFPIKAAKTMIAISLAS